MQLFPWIEAGRNKRVEVLTKIKRKNKQNILYMAITLYR
jgi:hypothetical protein